MILRTMALWQLAGRLRTLSETLARAPKQLPAPSVPNPFRDSTWVYTPFTFGPEFSLKFIIYCPERM